VNQPIRKRIAAAASALFALAAAAGCGLGPGEETEGEATLTVTRDFGAETMIEAEVSDPTESETVIRFLDREAELETRYGGGFVHSIDGLKGGIESGRSLDWFFFVNGIESDRGSADVQVRGGDRVWWDYRDWTSALRTPAVVGSWPEPFAQATAGAELLPVRIECAGERPPCERAAERLADEGVDASIETGQRDPAGEALTVIVGPWDEIDSDPLASQLARLPAHSGVYARFEGPADGAELVALDAHATETQRLAAGAGLVAGMRRGDDPPTWVVTGTDAAGVAAAADLLDTDSLANRYAVAVAHGTELALPQPSEAEAP
jgi:hypothetical protein